jgi:hypothetical protein
MTSMQPNGLMSQPIPAREYKDGKRMTNGALLRKKLSIAKLSTYTDAKESVIAFIFATCRETSHDPIPNFTVGLPCGVQT